VCSILLSTAILHKVNRSRSKAFLSHPACSPIRTLPGRGNASNCRLRRRPHLQAWLHSTARVGNFGVAILIVTVLIKIAFFPLANKPYASMAKMKAVQPQMMALRERRQNEAAAGADGALQTREDQSTCRLPASDHGRGMPIVRRRHEARDLLILCFGGIGTACEQQS
jgi:hypothetical protein